MSVSAGPNFTEDGLVLYYDEGNREKSWKGAPTTNLFSTTAASIGVDSMTGITTGTDEYGDYFIKSQADGATWWSGLRILQNGTTPLTSGSIYTFSIDFMSPQTGWTVSQDSNQTGGDWTGNDAGRISVSSKFSETQTTSYGSKSYVWNRFSYTVQMKTWSTGPNAYPHDSFFTNTDNVKIYYRNPQLELQPFSTPFVDGTRSTSQSILDLTNSNTLTISDLTYNSDGTFQFDGTNDFITVPQTVLSSSGSTVSGWINIADFSTGKSSTGRTFIRGTSNFTSMIAFYNGGYSFETNTNSNPHEIAGRTSGNVTSSAIVAGTWFHFTLVFNNGSFTGYVNGIQTGSAAISNSLTFDRIGDGSGFATNYPAFFKGKISSFAVYDRALSEAEVKRNFNSTRGRFGL